MLTLKTYQQNALSALSTYFRLVREVGDSNLAFYKYTLETTGVGKPYLEVPELPGLPYICLRMPTGGGKTVVASYAVGICAKDLLNAERCVVLWLVPSGAILEQTLDALRTSGHPYRQAVEAAVGPLRVLTVQEALYLTPGALAHETIVIVSTIQAFRVDDPEGRKVYESSGVLMEHFAGLSSSALAALELSPQGEVAYSLANLLRVHGPVVIMDEAHNARTPLSFETLARLHPSCIVEFTATPAQKQNPSNVLVSVTAAQLKAEGMIKMPIVLEVRSDWRQVVRAAMLRRHTLELLAEQESTDTGEYLRPILLLQAQPRSQAQDTLTPQVLAAYLMDEHGIPEEQIAIATGTQKDLDGVDLLDRSCPIRYVITIQALREGWDCPFAYVLCSVSELRASRAVEQILGRIMRLPRVTRKRLEPLNRAYAYSASQSFADAANALGDALVENGFTRFESVQALSQQPLSGLPIFGGAPPAAVLPAPPNTALTDLPPAIAAKISLHETMATWILHEEATEEDLAAILAHYPPGSCRTEALTALAGANSEMPSALAKQSRHPTQLAIPVLAVRRSGQLEPFEETHLLDRPWRLAQSDAMLDEIEFPDASPSGQQVEITVDQAGQLRTRFMRALDEQMSFLAPDRSWSEADLVHWLDARIEHPDLTKADVETFLAALVMHLMSERGFILDALVAQRYRLAHAAEHKIEEHRRAARHQAFQTFLPIDAPQPLEVSPDLCFHFDRDHYPYGSPYQGAYVFRKHYYHQIGDLRGEGEEFECAQFLDALPEVETWVRNLERRPDHAFWLQTSTDKFYPDFVCLLRDGRYLVVEYKGADRYSNEDSQEKRLLGTLWADRSQGRCLFAMPTGRQFEPLRQLVGDQRETR